VPDVVIDPRGIWPIGFRGDDIEAFAFDELLRDSRPHRVEFGRPVACFTDKHDSGLTDPGEESVEVGIQVFDERLAMLGDEAG